ncbi:MAG: hypothetical protein AB7G93_03455 [Bdellovibrionales bacterium]
MYKHTVKHIVVALIFCASFAAQLSPLEKAYADPERGARGRGRLGADFVYDQTWILNGQTATEEQLTNAIMDFWGGHPGTLCFVLPELAVGFVQQAFRNTRPESLVSVQLGGADGQGIVIATRSPFGGNTVASLEFRHCVGDELLVSQLVTP